MLKPVLSISNTLFNYYCFDLQELHSTCQAMQHRLVELIGKLANDEITAELLRVNDELNNLFLRSVV
jgi:hypothetical protein